MTQLELALACEHPVVTPATLYEAALAAFEAARAACSLRTTEPRRCPSCATPWLACVEAYKAMVVHELVNA